MLLCFPPKLKMDYKSIYSMPEPMERENFEDLFKYDEINNFNMDYLFGEPVEMNGDECPHTVMNTPSPNSSNQTDGSIGSDSPCSLPIPDQTGFWDRDDTSNLAIDEVLNFFPMLRGSNYLEPNPQSPDPSLPEFLDSTFNEPLLNTNFHHDDIFSTYGVDESTLPVLENNPEQDERTHQGEEQESSLETAVRNVNLDHDYCTRSPPEIPSASPQIYNVEPDVEIDIINPDSPRHNQRTFGGFLGSSNQARTIRTSQTKKKSLKRLNTKPARKPKKSASKPSSRRPAGKTQLNRTLRGNIRKKPAIRDEKREQHNENERRRRSNLQKAFAHVAGVLSHFVTFARDKPSKIEILRKAKSFLKEDMENPEPRPKNFQADLLDMTGINMCWQVRRY